MAFQDIKLPSHRAEQIRTDLDVNLPDRRRPLVLINNCAEEFHELIIVAYFEIPGVFYQNVNIESRTI